MTKNKNSVIKAFALTLALCICFSLVFVYAVEGEESEPLTEGSAQEETSGEESSEEETTAAPETTDEGEESGEETGGEESGEESKAESSEDSTSKPVTGPAELTGIRFSVSAYDLTVGETRMLTVLPTPEDAELPTIHFTSSNGAIAAVSADGTLTAVAAGEAKITATVPGTAYTCECTVRVAAATAPMDLNFIVNENTGDRIVTGFRFPSTVNEAISAVKTSLKITDGNVTITKADGSAISGEANLATGCIITAGGVQYTVVIRGDVNSDGRITTDDVTRVVQYLVGMADLSNAEIMAANVNGSSAITIENAYKIQRHIYGYESDKIVQK